jgi:hypothetical protein
MPLACERVCVVMSRSVSLHIAQLNMICETIALMNSQHACLSIFVYHISLGPLKGC